MKEREGAEAGADEAAARGLRELRVRHDALARSVRALSWQSLLAPAALMLVALMLTWGRLHPDDSDQVRVDFTLVGLLEVAGDSDRPGALGATAGVLFGVALAAFLVAVVAALSRQRWAAVTIGILSGIGILAGLALAIGLGRLELEDAPGVAQEGDLSLASTGWTLGMAAFVWLIAVAVVALKRDDPEDW